ncbi:DnaJ/Hsp40 cysteine-rich domain superfamily protein [Prunus dulcis]|uniref:DnaJ/Hsp40 cysteine-rich domain superfamily protein n=1 Tax=Prunus dulcis TaxID=3755 RepID=A0A4Y1RXN4_PRUDU|nr:DnaJ/Hsp40 cysteine-rich domain superfamily protein [Prunus dulcis]
MRVFIDNSIGGKVLRANEVFQNSKAANFQSWEVKATDGNQTTKTNSLVCSTCEGNGVKGHFVWRLQWCWVCGWLHEHTGLLERCNLQRYAAQFLAIVKCCTC